MPGIANQIRAMWQVLLQFAIDREYIIGNAAARVERLPLSEYSRWSEEAVAWAVKPGNLREDIRRAVVLGLHSGQRASDVCAMRWSDYDGAGIRLVQRKTGAPLWVPCHADLKRELDAWKAEAAATIVPAVTILTKIDGAPYRDGTRFINTMCKSLRSHPELDGCVYHGLRKTAAALLAEAGCSTLEIASITGHASLHELERYTRQADQRQRAVSAVAKLENYRRTNAGK